MTEREQWLERRKGGIGASEAAAIIGQSPYKTNVQLWEEKTGRRTPEDISDKPYIKYGNDAEDHLRALFALDFPQYDVGYDQFGMISNNPDVPFAFATLDGELTERNAGRRGVLEIKTTQIMRAGQYSEWKGRIPQHYYIQVLHQLLATGYDFAVLKAQIKFAANPNRIEIQHYHIGRSGVEDEIEVLKQAEITFWASVQAEQRPNLLLPQI